MTRHRFGLHLTDFAHPAWGDGQLLPRLTSVCQALEESPAFDTLWLNDHLHHPGPEGPMAPRPEAMMLLAAAAVPTSTLRLGLLVASATFRHPALLVKMVTTLDVLSGGRAVLGLGAGHPRTEVEHRTYGIPFPPLGERLDRLEDALQLTRQVAAFLEAGVDEVIVEVPSAHDPDAIRDAGKALEMAVQSAHVTL